MNDEELRAAAEEVARALGLCVEGYVCPWCGFNPGRATPEKHYEQDTCPTCQFSVEYETRPLDLLTEAGGGALQTALLTIENENDIPALHVGFEHDFSDFDGYRVRANINCAGHLPESSGFHDTWPGALVLAARVALRAGWLEGEGSDAE